jgi:putative ABC transport system substrate-binding protein
LSVAQQRLGRLRRAQQGERVRRIGVLIQVAEGDPQARIEVAAFLRSLQELGWSEGRIMT